MRKVLGTAWIIFGGVVSIYITIHLVQVYMRTNYDFIWYFTQSLFPLFGVLALVLGVGVLRKNIIAIKSIKYLSVLAILYFSAFILMGAHSINALIFGLCFLSYFIFSIILASKVQREQT